MMSDVTDVERKKKFSKSDTLEYIISVMKKEFNIHPGEDTQFWRKYSSKTYDRLTDCSILTRLFIM